MEEGLQDGSVLGRRALELPAQQVHGCVHGCAGRHTRRHLHLHLILHRYGPVQAQAHSGQLRFAETAATCTFICALLHAVYFFISSHEHRHGLCPPS